MNIVELDPRLRAAVTILPVVGLFAESVQVNAQPQKEILSVPEGYVFNMEKGIPSMREALNARGLDLDVEAQQNIENLYLIKTFFTDKNTGHNMMAGINGVQPPIPPNPAGEILIPTIDIHDRTTNTLKGQIQVNVASYQNIWNVNGESIAISSNGLITLGMEENIFDLQANKVRGYLRGGTAIPYYDFNGDFSKQDFSKQIRLPDEGISHIERNGTANPNQLTFVQEGSKFYYLLNVTQAVDFQNNGNYILDADATGKVLSTRWSKQVLITPTLTPSTTSTPTVRPETPTSTATSVSTSTVTPRATLTPVASLGTFGLSEMSSNTLQTSWSQRTESVGTSIFRYSTQQGVEFLPPGVILPPSQTTFIDRLPSNMTGLVCEGPIFFMTSGIKFTNLICDVLGTKSGMALENQSIRSDLANKTVALGFRGPGGQTNYLFLELMSGRTTIADGSATSITLTQTEATACYIGIVLKDGQAIGTGNVICELSLN